MELLAGTASGKEVIDNEGILQKARLQKMQIIMRFER